MDNSISIIIPTHNDIESLEKCLYHVNKAVLRCNYSVEVIIVDDYSNEKHTIEELCNNYNYKYVRTPSNLGPAHARNIGAKISRNSILFFIDSDVIIFDNTLQKIGHFISEHFSAMIGCYTTKIIHNDFFSNYKNLIHHYTHQNSGSYTSFFWTGCGIIHKKIFNEIGGFNTMYKKAQIEDVELGLRLSERNYLIYNNKELVVEHLKKYSFKSLFISDFCNRALPFISLLLKHKHFKNDQDTKNHNILSVVLTYCILLVVITSSFKLISLQIAIYFSITLYIITLLLNFHFFNFLFKEKGWIFTFKAFLYSFLYHIYCGLAVGIGFIKYLLKM